MAAPGALTNVVSADDGGSPTSISVSGMGTATNDRIAICVTGADRASSIGVDTAGWTLLNATTTNGVTIAVAYEAGSTDDSVAFSWTTGTSAAIIAGISPDTDFSSTAPAMNTNAASSTTGTTHTMPSVAWTPTGDDVRIISINALSDARRAATGYPDADNNTVTGGSGAFDAELAIATGGYTASSPQSPGDFTWNGSINGATQGVVLFEDTGAGAQTISPALVSQLVSGTAPQVNMNTAPALTSQLISGTAPQVDMNVGPASLVSQLLAATDPTVTAGPATLSPALVSQLLAATDPQLDMNVGPLVLVSQLLAATDPQVNMNIAAALVSQLLAASDPTLTPGPVTVSPALVSQLLAASDPQVNMSIATALVTQALSAIDPTQVDMNIAVALESQLLTAADPVVSQAGAQTVTPALVSQLLTATDPQLNMAVAVTLVTQSLAGIDPSLTPGAVSVSPALVSQLVAANAPRIDLELAPALVSQLLAASDPSLHMNIAATLVSQLLAAIDPTVTGGTLPDWIVINIATNWATQAEQGVTRSTGAVSSVGTSTGAEHG